jgi:predicted nucleotidyltransferase component of viral defense system
MRKKANKNTAASVKALLLNISRKSGIDHTLLLRRYAQERFIFRLSKTRYREKLVLKGAILSIIFGFNEFRPTKDIDFLCVENSYSTDEISEMVSEIIPVEVEDGIVFNSSFKVETIKKESIHPGCRIILPWNMERTTGSIQLDVGFGDVQYIGPLNMTFPTILGSEEPYIIIYSVETAIAEKIQTIASLGVTTSRMKDFYDIYHFCKSSSFKYEDLLNSLKSTFKNRDTPLNSLAEVFTEGFVNNKTMIEQWKAFLHRNELLNEQGFTQIIEELRVVFLPLIKEEDPGETWDPYSWCWK